MASYHVARDGQEIGVFDQAELQAKVGEGSIRVTDLCWTTGMPDWVSVGQMLSSIGTPPPSNDPNAAPVWTSPASPGGARPPMPPSYLPWAIVTTLLCCLPFGIVAIVYASKVESNYYAGNLALAQSNSSTAKLWCWISFWSVAAPVVLFFLFLLLTGGLAAFMESMREEM